MTEQRNRYRRDYSELEAEVAEHEQDDLIEQTPTETPEDISWKKRYGDLRAHAQQKENETNKKLAELAARLDAAQEENTKVPTNRAELDEWMDKYPRVAGIVRTMIVEEMDKVGKKINEIEQKNEKVAKQNEQEKAKIELTRVHPDFYQSLNGRPPIVETEEFHQWIRDREAEGEPEAREALYDNETNAKKAARWISIYKQETNYNSKSTKSAKANSESAGSSVKVRGSSPTPRNTQGDYEFTESQINRMSEREFALNEEAINSAMRTGKFLYDITGAAR